jgi:hypothetical protein
MEVAGFFEMLEIFYQTRRHHKNYAGEGQRQPTPYSAIRTRTRQIPIIKARRMIYYLYIHSDMFRSYDHHQAEKYIATLGLLN